MTTTSTATPISGATTTTGTRRSTGRFFLRRMVQYRPGFVSFLVIVFLYLLAFVGPLIYRKSPNRNRPPQSPRQAERGSSARHGRQRARHPRATARWCALSLIVGLIAVLIADTVGVLSGAFAGYFGKGTDSILMRITDALLAIPSFLLLLLVLTLLSPSFTKLVIAIGLTSWMTIARLVRSEFLRHKETEFVQAAKAMGASNLRVIFRHICRKRFPRSSSRRAYSLARSLSWNLP